MHFGLYPRYLRWLIAPAIVWVLYVLRANVWFRLYPVIMVAGAFLVFAISLFRTPLIECFARRMGTKLDARGIVYCRMVTRVWVSFLLAHLVVTVLTVFASYEVWAFYNGFLAYVLMGVLFFGEWLVRRRILSHG